MINCRSGQETPVSVEESYRLSGWVVVLGLHYPTDVICGAVLGFLLGALTNVLLPLTQ